MLNYYIIMLKREMRTMKISAKWYRGYMVANGRIMKVSSKIVTEGQPLMNQ